MRRAGEIEKLQFPLVMFEETLITSVFFLFMDVLSSILMCRSTSEWVGLWIKLHHSADRLHVEVNYICPFLLLLLFVCLALICSSDTGCLQISSLTWRGFTPRYIEDTLCLCEVLGVMAAAFGLTEAESGFKLMPLRIKKSKKKECHNRNAHQYMHRHSWKFSSLIYCLEFCF